MLMLSNQELVALTRRDRPTAQAKVLRVLGIPFRVHPTDGALLVSRTAAESVLANSSTDDLSLAQPVRYEVDIEGIRKHGKAATSR